MRRLVIILLVLVPSLNSKEATAGTPIEQYKTLLSEYEAAIESWDKRFDAGCSDEVKVDWVARLRDWPAWSFAARFLEIAEMTPDDPAAIDALLWVVSRVRDVGMGDRRLYPHYQRAVERLARGNHLNDERVVNTYRSALAFPSPRSEDFLRNALEQGRDRAVRGTACLALAQLLVAKGMIARDPWFDRKVRTPFDAYQSEWVDCDYAQYVRESDPQRSEAEAEGLFERAMEEYGDLTWRRTPGKDGHNLTIADIAKSELQELRTLAVGKVAPEIEGEDIDGMPMRLSDHRGKIVVLSFWATWCGPCMSLVPHERALVERMAGEPFVLLGVDGDEDREQVRKVVKRERISWRSWWNGGPTGPITDRWNVDAWPRVYVLDAGGVIRYKQVFKESLDDAVDALLREMATAKP